MTESDADAATASNNQFHRLLRRLINVTPAELPALGWCWFYIFSVLASYYILRPIRDQMGVAVTDDLGNYGGVPRSTRGRDAAGDPSSEDRGQDERAPA